MKEQHFSIEIRATKEKVWDTLWRDETFRDWASVIDPETYMVGVLSEGSEVQFLSAQGGYGVTSLVEVLIVNEFLLLAIRQTPNTMAPRHAKKNGLAAKKATDSSKRMASLRSLSHSIFLQHKKRILSSITPKRLTESRHLPKSNKFTFAP